MRSDFRKLKIGFIGLLMCQFSFAAVLENEALRIEFADAAQGYNVERIYNRLAGEVAFGAPTKRFVRFWMLEFWSTDGGSNVTHTVSNTRAALSKNCEIVGDVATFTWQGLDLPGEKGALDVRVRVHLESSTPLSTWQISTTLRSRKWALAKTVFPALTRLVNDTDPTAKVLVPSKNMGGQLYSASEWALSKSGTQFRYPSCRLQMLAFLKGDAGLYFATHDPKGFDKTFVLAKDGTAWCEALVENAGIPSAHAMGPGFAVTIGAFRDDWYAAAHLYRAWALKQKWAAKGPIAQRADFPRRAAKTHLWVIGGGHTNEAARTFAGMDRVWPHVGKALTWSEWTEKCGGHATNRGDPEFFPAYPGIGDLARKEVAAGYLVFPYINARLWDVSTAGFAYAVRDATQKRDGTYHTETYRDGFGAQNVFAVMCPATPTWRRVITQIALRCLDELGMNGVYLDQVSCSPAMPCFNRNHGHSVGGGAWWVEGYRAMLTELKREFIKRDAALVSEQLGEMWLDLIDVYLNGTSYEKYDVPLFPAVYQGYCIHYGRPVPLNISPKEAFREYARTLIWGEAFGWIEPGVPIYAAYAVRQKLLYEMAQLREKYAAFFVYGTLEGALVVEDSLRPAAPENEDLFGTVWQDVDGKNQVAFAVNATEYTRTVKVRFPGSATTREVTLPPQSVTPVRKDL